MPIEATLLEYAPPPLRHCPLCGNPFSPVSFRPFLRGQVFPFAWRLRRWLGLPYVCVICADCKEIVGLEKPPAVDCP